jgi:cytochrome P450
MSEFVVDIDFFDPAQTQHMWDRMAELRAHHPVARTRQGFWYTARYPETLRVFRDYAGFSCAGGHRAPGVDVHPDDRLLAETDPPAHLHQRKLLLRAFGPEAPVKAEPFARAYIRALLEDARGRGSAELVAELSMRIPTAVTCHLLGVPTADIPRIAAWIYEAVHTDWPSFNVRDRRHPERDVGLEGAAPRFCAYLDEQIDQRRRSASPPDDLISGMLRAEVDGQRLSDRRIRTLCVNFLSGGFSTTNLVSNLLYRLLTDPDLDARLRAQPALIPVAVEESLRVDPPVLFLFRTAARDLELGGVQLRRGERVVMGIASANRDDSVFEEPERFRLDRPNGAAHLSFGAGGHLCLGNTLARMEGRVAVEELHACFPPGRLRLAPGFRYELVPHFLEYGPAHLEVEASPA